ncbi:MAG: ABC transporter ATP-binding protein [Deltaproteobacteria bacterium]|nr:MAG: ABC transporter ATP-binding protein [Deltaproteobacteria bacterium]
MPTKSSIYELNEVWFRYNRHWILKKISFQVERGELLGIIGPNGSGKTTLLRILDKILIPQRGKVVVDGLDIRGIRRKEIAQMVAVVPQEPQFSFSFSVLEVVLMGRAPHLRSMGFEGKNDYDIARRAMELTDTWRFSARTITELSGGERQRVLIARALTQEPEILLLDEPTNHLDINHQVEIMDLIRELNTSKGLTVIVVSHDINLSAEYCDRIVILSEGEIHKIGSVREVVTAQNLHDVYGARVLVDTNPASQAPRVTLLSREG